MPVVKLSALFMVVRKGSLEIGAEKPIDSNPGGASWTGEELHSGTLQGKKYGKRAWRMVAKPTSKQGKAGTCIVFDVKVLLQGDRTKTDE